MLNLTRTHSVVQAEHKLRSLEESSAVTRVRLNIPKIEMNLIQSLKADIPDHGRPILVIAVHNAFMSAVIQAQTAQFG